MIGPFILMYHSIADHLDDPYSVPINAFRQQISWIFENGFDVVSLSCLLRSLQERNYRSLKKKLVITFDDGYQDFVTNALPILHEHRATATVFLVTGMLGERASWNKSGADERLMSEEDVRSIKAHGISLGSHTATHANLTLLDHKEVRRQLKDSSDKLAQLGETFYAFSYPWGQWTSGIADTVREEGYECALAVGEKTRLIAFNTHCLPRITMGRAIDSKRFQTLLTRTHVEMELRRRFWILRDKWSSLLR